MLHTIALVFLLTLRIVSVVCAQVTLGGSYGSQLMNYIQELMNFVFYFALTGCLASLIAAGYKFSQGDQGGMEAVKRAIIGTAIATGAAGIFKYLIYTAQNLGVSGKGSLF
jgi:hypothetical protein